MMLINRTIALTSLFLALPFLVHAHGGGDGQPNGSNAQNKIEPGDFKRVIDALTDLEKRMQNGFGVVAADIKQITTDINVLSRNYDNAMRRIELLERDIKSLRTEIDNLKTIDDLRTKLNQMDQRLSKLQPPTRRESYSAPRATGQILLANHWGDTLTFYVNEKSWVVPAKSTTLIEDVPIGRFSYRVSHPRFGVLKSDPEAVLSAGQTYTLSARDR